MDEDDDDEDDDDDDDEPAARGLTGLLAHLRGDTPTGGNSPVAAPPMKKQKPNEVQKGEDR